MKRLMIVRLVPRKREKELRIDYTQLISHDWLDTIDFTRLITHDWLTKEDQIRIERDILAVFRPFRCISEVNIGWIK